LEREIIMTQELRKRQEVPVEYTWDTANIYVNDDAWEAAIAAVQEQLPSLASFQGRLGNSPAVLVAWLDQVDLLVSALGKIYNYAGMFQSVDSADQAASARVDRARGLYGRALAMVAYGEPEVLAIGLERLRQWMEQEPRLAVFDHYFDDLFYRQAHVRSAEVEEVLGQVVDPFGTASATHGVLADTDIVFQPARSSSGESLEVAQSTINALLTHADGEVRRTAWESYSDAHLAFKNTMANCLAAGVKQDVFRARVRRYPSALEAALSPNHIPAAVFHNTLNTFRRNLPTWHRYWRVRRQALGYDKLHVYDIKAPLTAATPKVPYRQAISWIVEGMRPLGEEYTSTMRRGLMEQRWVDIYPNQGKRMGAYSSGVKGTHPFIFMSYSDDLFSLSTLAHELGHSMHSYYTWQSQPQIYADYSMFVAEVASNFNQALVRAYLLENNLDREFQIALIEEAMANFHRYFFIMPILAIFELEIHERTERGEALTADVLIGRMAELFREGYGDEVEFDHDRIGITWAEFHTHLYSNFYVYQYTTGIAGAHALAADILAQKPGAAENYLAFLKVGSSVYALDALKLAGVDMASPEPVEKTFAVLAGIVDRLEKLTAG
jgi:oligoendopeptidase F